MTLEPDYSGSYLLGKMNLLRLSLRLGGSAPHPWMPWIALTSIYYVKCLVIVIGLILECRFMIVSMCPPFMRNLGDSSAVCKTLSIIISACTRARCHYLVAMTQDAHEWLTRWKCEFPICTPFNASLDACMFGSPFCIEWRIASAEQYVSSRECRCRKGNFLFGKPPVGSNAWHMRIWPLMAAHVTDSFNELLGFTSVGNTKHLAGILCDNSKQSLADVLDDANFVVPSKRSRTTASNKVSSCVQPSRRVAPTLLLEGLGSAVHLEVALSLQHPFSRPPPLESHVDDAFRFQHREASDLIGDRESVALLLNQLADAVRSGFDSWIQRVHVRIRPVVALRHVSICREVSFCIGWVDLSLWSEYVQSLPMGG